MLAGLLTHLPLFFSLLSFPLTRGTLAPVAGGNTSSFRSLLVAHRHRLGDHSYCKHTGTSQTPVWTSCSGHLPGCYQGRSPCTGPALSLSFGHLSVPCSAGGQQVGKALGLSAPASLERGDQTLPAPLGSKSTRWESEPSLGLRADGPSLRGPDPFSTQVASEE